MDSVIEIPIGSLVGLCVVVLVVGVVLGRSGRFMRKIGELHARAHGGNSVAVAEGGNAEGGHAAQRVQTVVMVGGHQDQIDREHTTTGRWSEGRTVSDVQRGTEHAELVGAAEALNVGTVDCVGPGRFDLIPGWEDHVDVVGNIASRAVDATGRTVEVAAQTTPATEQGRVRPDRATESNSVGSR